MVGGLLTAATAAGNLGRRALRPLAAAGRSGIMAMAANATLLARSAQDGAGERTLVCPCAGVQLNRGASANPKDIYSLLSAAGIAYKYS